MVERRAGMAKCGQGIAAEKRLNAVLYGVLALVGLFFLVLQLILPRTDCSCSTGRERDESTAVYLPVALDGTAVTDGRAGSDGEQAEDSTTAEEGAGAPEVNPFGYHLIVDLDKTLMTVYKDGILVKTYDVSGGKASSPSPVGTWKIISKDTWGEGFGGAWMGFNVPWGIYGIHGTSDPWSVGRSNASKGCIRMRNPDARELYKMVPYGTTVTILYKNRPFYPMMDGDVGSDVLDVERWLKRLGYYHGSEDGVFGASLKSAVREFQKDHNLYRTGVVNISTYEKLKKLASEMEE